MNLDTLRQLTEAMTAKGDNTAAAALAIGVSEKTLSNWLAGRNEPRSEAILALISKYCEKNRVECAWCNTEMKPGSEPTSHGICPECAEKMRTKAREE